MNSATLQAPSQTVPSRNRQRKAGEATPKSMQVPSNTAAISSPSELDYHAVVRGVMCIQNKSGLGFRLVSNKSKNHVFALSCDAVRNLCGLAKFDAENKLVPVSPEIEKAIRNALQSVWVAEMNALINYGGALDQSDLRMQWDAPVTKAVEVLDDNGKQVERDGKKVYDLSARLSATARVTRSPKDLSEMILVVSLRTTAAKNRLKQMQDKPGKYERDEVRAQHDLVTLHEWKLAQLYQQKAAAEGLAKSITMLDELLAGGKLTQAEYAAKRTEIETAA